MAKQSVLGAPSAPKGGASRTGFSRSQAYTFTGAAGMLLPAYRELLNYGEKVTGLPKAFIRTEPLLAPSMTDLDLYVDVFFVPMTHLISMYDSWFTQVSDDKSALWTNSNWHNYLPVVRKDVSTVQEAFGWMTGTIWHYINSSQDDGLYNVSNFGFDLHRLTQMLGYNAQALAAPFGPFDYDENPITNLLPAFHKVAKNIHQDPFCPYFFMAYQKIYFDYYRDSNYEVNNVKAYNIDDVLNSGNDAFYPSDVNDPRLGMFKLRYRNRTKDYFTAIHPNPLFNGIGMLPNAMDRLSRIKQWLTGQSPSPTTNFKTGTIDSVGINTYADLQKVAGGSDFDTTDNLQYHTQGGSPVTTAAGTFSLAEGELWLDNDDEEVWHKHKVDLDDIINNITSDNTPISLAQVRSAFALDKLLRITNRAGKHVDDQIMAEFGVKIPQGVSGEVYKLKSYHSIFHIGEVIQSATTVDASGNDVPLGEMAGRGVAMLNGNEKFSFTAPCTGVLMAIVSVSPRYKYAFAQEKDGCKVYIEDFFRPQYDNLGMQPMLGFELGSSDSSILPAWQYRYMEDKIKFDKAAMVFATNSKNPWSFVKAPTDRSYFGRTANSDYAAPISLAWQKVSPYDLNNLFVAQYDGNPGYPGESTLGLYAEYKTPAAFLSVYLKDPFTIDWEMTLTKVSQMSTYGEPSLGGI